MANEQQAGEVKAGVATPSGPQGDSPSSIAPKGTEQSGSQTVTPAAQPPVQEKPEQIPYGDKRHPEYRRFKELSESSKRANERADKLERELAEMRGFKDAMMAQNGRQNELPPEQKQALVSLFQMGMTVPEVKDMIAKSFGLDRLDSLHKDFSSFKEGWEGNQYDAEMKEVLSHAKELGLDQEEVEEDLREHVESHPFFSKKDYFKGGVWAAFRDKYWDKSGELRERAENKKKIEERERLKAGQTQVTSPTANPGEIPLPKDDGIKRNIEIIRRMGGVGNVFR